MEVEAALVGTWPPGQALDLDLTFKSLQLMGYDPTSVLTPTEFRKAFWSPRGPCSLIFHRQGLEAMGPGAGWCQEHLQASLVFQDEPFSPATPLLRECSRVLAGLRLLRVPWVGDIAAKVILQQRVATSEAARSYRQLVEALGESSPCGKLRLPLSRSQWLSLTTARLRSFGIDEKRATTLLRAADHGLKLDRLYFSDFPTARRLLDHIPGVGPWTREMVMGFALGDPDAVPTGDLHLPHVVAQVLAREPRGSDERMLQLLEPYRGHRFRILRWLQSGRVRSS